MTENEALPDELNALIHAADLLAACALNMLPDAPPEETSERIKGIRQLAHEYRDANTKFFLSRA